jgi:hypothetical protein
MFEPISASLSQLSSFAVLGFFLAAFYEIIRIIRLFKKQSDLLVGITDFLFLSLAGLITFAYSMELGNGWFRWFYIAGVIFGGTVYFLTVGRLVSLASNFIVKLVKRVFRFVVKCIIMVFLFVKKHILIPIWKKLCKISQFFKSKIGNSYVFLRKSTLNSINHLKSRVKIVYNKRTIKNTIAGDERNVIKGKIRKPSSTTVTLRKT